MSREKPNKDEKEYAEGDKENITKDLNPLERKFGKEPKIDDLGDLWRWH
ncbi:MAG: hypothetical protein ACFFE8_06940 [Candidatus Heimdallarchaeota archaeon]